ncbi:MAG: hypothetical protein KY410_06500 [Proteobacteria bacterium]|nr:hypothetical protein [Pseudomonadota bacterium]
MLRILVAAAVLLAAAYFYMNQGGEESRPLETQQQALEKAKAVEKTVQDQADALKKQINEQTANDDGQP